MDRVPDDQKTIDIMNLNSGNFYYFGFYGFFGYYPENAPVSLCRC